MKKMLGCLIIGLCLSVTAQTNPPVLRDGLNEIKDAFLTSTNWALVVGYGRALEGNRNLAFADLCYRIPIQPVDVGLILGYDALWSSDDLESPATASNTWKPKASGSKTWNAVRGGLSLSMEVQPFKFLGGDNYFTRMKARPFVADLLATPRDGAPVGNILVTGANVSLVNVGRLQLGAMGAWEQRSGQGVWDGSYLLIGLTGSLGF